MSARRGLDWPSLMRVGMQRLGLNPGEFWALTPVELQVMLGASAGPAPMLSDGLAALMAAYPDKKEGPENG